MPLVISQHAKQTSYVASEEDLSQILGHSNFDGENWAVGDLIVFEDGTGAPIAQEENFHVWPDPVPIELSDVLAKIRSYGDPRLPSDAQVDSFEKLFARFTAAPPKKSGWRSWFSK